MFHEALVCGIKEFHPAVDINHVLGELYKLLAADKISPPHGALRRNAERCVTTVVEPDGYDGWTSIPGNSN